MGSGVLTSFNEIDPSGVHILHKSVAKTPKCYHEKIRPHCRWPKTVNCSVNVARCVLVRNNLELSPDT